MPTRRKGRAAWLITWEWDGDHARMDEGRVAAVLPPRSPLRTVERAIVALYAQRELAPTDMLRALEDNPYPAQPVERRFKMPDGTVGRTEAHEIICGGNPFLRARRVDNLRDDPNRPGELLWAEREPPSRGLTY
jgi:hypothetical protein